MKKLLSGLMAGAVVISFASSLVSCSSFTAIAEIYLVTDAGKISDKSFNESTYKSGTEFLQNVAAKLDNKYKSTKISKIEPENPSTKILENQYKNAKNNGAKTILLPGFHHAIPGEGNSLASKIMEDVEYGSTIMLDGTSARGNEIGFNFRGDISGFYAGMATIIWSLKNTTHEKISLGSFGGIANPQAVDNFIVGYLAAIEVFNKTKETNTNSLMEKFELKSDDLKREVKMTQEELPKDTSDANWYTQSFAQGDGVTISNTLISKGSTVILPVAGPQTLDAIGASKTFDGGKKVKIIGVDTNQAEAFPQNKDMFITSAEKDLTNATIVGLAHTKHWIRKFGPATNNGAFKDQMAITNEVSEYLKERISLTRENSDKTGFDEIKLNDPESWEGSTMWVGGNMSSDGLNLLKKDTADLIKSIWIPKVLTDASIDLFKTINKGGFKTLINKDTIKDYAKIILKGGN